MSYQTVNLEIEVDSEEIASHIECDCVAQHIDTSEVAQHIADDIDPMNVAEHISVSEVVREIGNEIDMDELAEAIMRRANPELMSRIRQLSETMRHVAKIGGAI